jgi:hypothetical protein
VPEAGLADVGLEFFPAKGAKGVAGVNGENGKEQVPIICATDDVPEPGTAELAEMENATRAIEKEGDNERAEPKQPPLPRRSKHIEGA